MRVCVRVCVSLSLCECVCVCVRECWDIRRYMLTRLAIGFSRGWVNNLIRERGVRDEQQSKVWHNEATTFTRWQLREFSQLREICRLFKLKISALCKLSTHKPSVKQLNNACGGNSWNLIKNF